MILSHIYRLRGLFLMIFSGWLCLFSSAQNFPNPATLSTGQGPLGTLDPIWTVSPWFASAPPGPMGLTYTPALISNNCAPGSWVNPASLPPPVNNGNWITGNDPNCAGNTNAGYKYFRLTLDLPPDCNGNSIGEIGNYVLSLSGYVDNVITDVFLNGNSLGISGGNYTAGSQLDMTISGPWIPGLNYVDVLVYNVPNGGSNPYGLLLVANSSATSGLDSDGDGFSDLVDLCPCTFGVAPDGCQPAITADQTICEGEAVTVSVTGGDSYLWSNGSVSSSITVSPNVSTSYSVNVTNQNGSSYQLVSNVTVLPVDTTHLASVICTGEQYNFGNNTYSLPGTYTLTTISVTGCDSVVILNLDVLPAFGSQETVTACDSYTWNGQTYTNSGQYTYQTVNISGCDSTAVLDLTINESNNSITNVTACDNYTWNGQTYNTSGQYAYQTVNEQGCDSLAQLDLIILNSSSSTQSVTACGSFYWSANGVNYTSSGQYTTTILNSSGCDSLITLNLTINTTTVGTDIQTACGSYTWIDGITYTSSTSTPTYILTNSLGCDSLVTLDLTINSLSTSMNSATACDAYTWNGQTYSSSGQYTYQTVNISGCDSTAILNLTINESNNSITNVTACDNYTWNGQTYNASGQYSYQTVNAQGCDSAVTLNLVLNQSINTSETIWVCELVDTGSITQNSQTIFGCDSTHTINYELLPESERAQAEFSTNPSATVLLPSGGVEVINNSLQSSLFLWNFGETSIWIAEYAPSYTYSSPGQYTITLLADNEYNCPDTAVYSIMVMEDLLVYVPNAFTPDGDEFNNLFYPIISGDFDPNNYSLLIFNRWGEVIFESRNAEVGWDGTYGGNKVQDGTYIWKIRLKSKYNDETKEFVGHVTVLK